MIFTHLVFFRFFRGAGTAEAPAAEHRYRFRRNGRR